MRISHYFFYFGPGAVFNQKNGLIGHIGIVPEPKDFFDPKELKPIEHEKTLTRIVKSYLSILANSSSGRSITIKKLVPDKNRAHPIKKDFFSNGWRICRRRSQHPGGVEVLFKQGSCPVCSNKRTHAFYFIGVCERGHLCQPDWWKIVHHQKGGECRKYPPKKYLLLKIKGRSLEEHELECPYCGENIKLIDVISQQKEKSESLNNQLKCCGQFPEKEENSATEYCNNNLKVTRYIASYLRYAVNYEFIFFLFKEEFLSFFEHIWDICLRTPKVCDEIEIETLKVILEIQQQNRTNATEKVLNLPDDTLKCYLNVIENIQEKLRAINENTKYYGHMLEYFLLNSLIENPQCLGKDGDFLIDPVRKVGSLKCPDGENTINIYALEDFYNYLVQLGYKRVNPETGKLILTPYRESDKDIYLALERRGEGIYFHFPKITLKGNRLRIWQNIRNYYQSIKESPDISSYIYFKFTDPDGFIDLTPQYVYLHTLAHLLIRAISKIAGYSVASIRDRIYLYENKNDSYEGGILIYVGGEDVDGSMGGLTGIFNNPNTLKELFETVNKLTDCSNDPLCLEQTPRSNKPYGGACHLCLFLPETACGYFNIFLDRQLYIDNPIDVAKCKIIFEKAT